MQVVAQLLMKIYLADIAQINPAKFITINSMQYTTDEGSKAVMILVSSQCFAMLHLH